MSRAQQPPSFVEHGACAGADLSLFYPVRGESAAKGKAICATCPVLTACREWAIARRERHGTWGGLSERERRKILADTPRPAHQDAA